MKYVAPSGPASAALNELITPYPYSIRTMSAGKLRRYLDSTTFSFVDGSQGDAREFMMSIITTLEKERALVVNNFKGSLQIITECRWCGKTQQDQPFFCLTLPITGRNLEQCIQNFFNSSVEGAVCTCGRPLVVTKMLNCAPPCLIIHLNRFSIVGNPSRYNWCTQRIEKNNDYVYCPDQIHPMGCSYSLYATVSHSGSVRGGHYVASAMVDNQWYNFNDSSVSPEHHTSTGDEYILCYRRI